jgi:serine/threonine protein kinase
MADGTGTQPDLPHVPELAERYEFVSRLGSGGTAVVYLAREREVDRFVAIKLIRSAFFDEEAVERLAREARTAARLQHTNIVLLLGVTRLDGGGLALVLQYVPGPTLKARIQEVGPLPFARVRQVLRDMGRALNHAHRQRIVHRDIKPENIYLDRDTGLARLADFGIARSWDSDSSLTLPGTAVGTPTYMSPEQVDGRPLDGRSDLYSLGLVGWEMLTGRRPWEGESLYSVLFKQKSEHLPPLYRYRPDVPQDLRTAIERALAKEPDDRWPRARDFLAALDSEASGAIPQATGRTIPTVPVLTPTRSEVASPDSPAAGPGMLEATPASRLMAVGREAAGRLRQGSTALASAAGPAGKRTGRWLRAAGARIRSRVDEVLDRERNAPTFTSLHPGMLLGGVLAFMTIIVLVAAPRGFPDPPSPSASNPSGIELPGANVAESTPRPSSDPADSPPPEASSAASEIPVALRPPVPRVDEPTDWRSRVKRATEETMRKAHAFFLRTAQEIAGRLSTS